MKLINNRNIFKLLLLSFITVFSNCKKNNDTPVSDTSYPQYGTPFANVPNTQDVIVYQVNLRAFSSDASFKGVTARLDSIKALGANVVYLLPIYPVGVLKSAGGLGSPYAVKDYKAVNPEFGTLADLQNLVNTAHAKNMAVMFDWVADHTSWDNAWISNKSWYQQDANGNIISPPGYNDVAALNFTNQTMRTAMIDAMKYWVFTANIDGYRCDFADNVPFDFWKQAIDALRSITTHKLIMLAEGARSDHFNAGFNMRYGFAYYSALEAGVFGSSKSVTTLQDLNTSEYAGALPGSQVMRYTTNHDVYSSDGSPITVYGGKTGSMAAFLVTAYMKGVPMIYNGQEVGCTRDLNIFYHNPIDWTTNPDMTAEYKKILNFRAGSDAVKNGQLTQYSSDDVAVFTKSTSSQKVLVIANLRNNAVTYTIPASLSASGWKNAFTGASVTLNSQMYLQPYQHMALTQ
ncbi:alpha-amylase family glycosyl hydrolase [uncultured Mucilaginibacter sp.]|uniref:alpha-amylase family glycosyl hydrolase n=1 Tax=uncultured Mucilaginibacter sp. TaxID=797541 RepID=UPI002639DCDB|nr:alpha-amylase family glycosyl hydrolase [uncultured Mucilaginibacter sp.]